MQLHQLQFDEKGNPYLPTELRGYRLLQNPKLNKGSAFTREERAALDIEGRLPQQVETMEEQLVRCYKQYSEKATDLQKNIYLNSLHDDNEVLFYRLLE